MTRSTYTDCKGIILPFANKPYLEEEVSVKEIIMGEAIGTKHLHTTERRSGNIRLRATKYSFRLQPDALNPDVREPEGVIDLIFAFDEKTKTYLAENGLWLDSLVGQHVEYHEQDFGKRKDGYKIFKSLGTLPEEQSLGNHWFASSLVTQNAIECGKYQMPRRER